MRKSIYVLLLLLPCCAWAGDFDCVMQLAKRRVSWLVNNLVFKKMEVADKKETFQLQSKNGKIMIAATGPNAAAVGLNWYLKYYCHRSMSHMGDNLSPVSPLPVVTEAVTIDATAQYRYALNYCTYNYTMSFYSWSDWEHELDWMALNGVNLMLVANGEEAVWQNVLQRIGYSKKEMEDFITGPAYNAWWLMGNIEGWGGPMPQSQIDSRKVLVQKMIARMQALGIEPVMPGFYGMVPHNFNSKTKARVITQGNWGAFIRPAILDPTDTAFNRVAGIFYEESKKLYGRNICFFSGDPFHEGGITNGVDLGKAGANIQRAMQQYFPGAIWVLQGWQDNPKKELLAETDKSALLIQELFGENTNNWETRNGYEGTPFIWCCVNNFGERPGLNGKLERYAGEVYRAATGPFREYMKGVGIMPEGINNNPLSYDLVLELGWHSQPVETDKWINGYVKARYGKANDQIATAWKLFQQTIYSNPGYQEGPPENILCARPALQVKSVSSWGKLKKGYDTALFEKGVQAFASAAPLFGNSETYKIDLINFTRQVLSNRADTVFANLVTAYKEENTVAFNAAAEAFLSLHALTNELLNSHSYYRLTSYQQQALRSGNTPAEKKNNLHNAMMLITYWGGNNQQEDYLHEYAYKEWGGMMTTFYQQRWKLYFDYLRNNLAGKSATPPDFFAWEREWVTQNEQVKSEVQPYPSLEKVVQKVLLLQTAPAQKKIGNETHEQKEKRMAWWTHDRFGMFIHWGLYSQAARHEWVKRWERMSNEQYQPYFDTFNPDMFDPKTWAKQAKAAGMKYAVLTTKHHEGFCLFDSKYTDYKSTKTKAKRDLVKEFVDAFRAEGIRIGFYYSLIDWHHPDFTVDGVHPLQPKSEADSDYAKMNKGRDWNKYKAYLHNQVRELLTNYGKIDILWLDFSYPNSNGHGKGKNDWGSVELLKMIRQLQPGIIVDNRLDLDEYSDGADFATPEQVKPSELQSEYGGMPFETCQTFSGSWGYFRDENTWKSNRELLTLLITAVSKSGNLILNVGPTARGYFDYRAVRALDSVGVWMKYNQQAIYGCTQAPAEYKAPENTLLTYNPVTKKIYLHLMQYNQSTLTLPGYKGKIKYAQFLHDNSEIKYQQVGDNSNDLQIKLPQRPNVEIPVIELTLQP